MTSPRQTNTPERGGDEVDAFSRKARRLLVVFRRAGVAKTAKRAFNRRVRRARVGREEGPDDEQIRAKSTA